MSYKAMNNLTLCIQLTSNLWHRPHAYTITKGCRKYWCHSNRNDEQL